MIGAGETVTFWVLGTIAVIASMGLLFAKKAVHAALGMALAMLIVGIFYLTQQAPFLGIVHIFVYSGAVMMLFLFVLMLIGVDSSDSLVETIKGQKVSSFLLTLGLAAILFSAIGRVVYTGNADLSSVNSSPGNVTGMADLIFGKDVWVFEITGALLITAALGAMVLAHRERLTRKPTQRELSERRFHEGEHLSGYPVPGVYARHNAVDTPALLPDGTPSELSVSRVLTAREQVGAPGRFSSVEEEIQREIEEGGDR